MSEQVFDFPSAKEKERLMGMSFDELSRLQMQLLDMPQSKETDPYIQLIWEVLRERGDNPYGLTDEVICAEKEDFYENYCGRDIENDSDLVPESLLFVASSERKPKKKPLYRILRGAAVAAVIAVILCCVSSAFGFSVFRIFTYKGDGTLLFSPKELSSQETEQHAFPDLNKEILRHRSELPLVPNYDPKDCVLESIEANNFLRETSIVASYRHDEGHIYFEYSFYASLDEMGLTEIQINNGESKIYDSGGTRFYISRNLDQVSIIWFTENVKGFIWGDFTEEEAMQMVDSLN